MVAWSDGEGWMMWWAAWGAEKSILESLQVLSRPLGKVIVFFCSQARPTGSGDHTLVRLWSQG